MNLETLALAVRSNFKTLQEGEIIGRIMIISGRSFTRSFQGYKLLCEKQMFPEGFISHSGYWEKMLKMLPNVSLLMDRFDLVPGKMTELEYQGFQRPVPMTREEAIAKLNLPSLPDLDF
jgi:hypothetical protein